jgi:hypothetical protein
MGRASVERVAKYLGVSVLQVMQLSGQLSADDLEPFGRQGLARIQHEGLCLLQSDVAFSRHIRTPIETWPDDAKSLVATLYLQLKASQILGQSEPHPNRQSNPNCSETTSDSCFRAVEKT